MRKMIVAYLAVVSLVSISTSRTSYTGYSGAPGSKGTCASSCHGSSGGKIKVTGFPTAYVAAQQYQIKVSRNGGEMIRQFNASCRTGTSSNNAGTIGQGSATTVYNVSGETNGVHLSTSLVDSAAFTWTAPAKGTGVVRLYLAGLQGSKSGANTELVLVANESSTAITLPSSARTLTIAPGKHAVQFNTIGQAARPDRSAPERQRATGFFLIRQTEERKSSAILFGK